MSSMVHPSVSSGTIEIQVLNQNNLNANEGFDVNRAETGDDFGNALATGDFNKDGFSDLAIGVPGEDVKPESTNILSAGAVNVIFGSSLGLSPIAITDQVLIQPRAVDGSERGPEVNDQLGSALATGDFNKNGFSDLAIGVPGEDIGEDLGFFIRDAGAVNMFYGDSHRLKIFGQHIFSQNITAEIEGDAEINDNFGSALATGDFNKDTASDLAIGVPGEDEFGGIEDMGAVNVIYGSSRGLKGNESSPNDGRVNQIWLQGFNTVGEPINGDRFGHVLATGDFNNDTASDLAIGVPGDDASIFSRGAGAVNVIYGSSIGLNNIPTNPGDGRVNQIWTQNSQNVEEEAQVGDNFGSALATGDFNKDTASDLAIGVPGEDSEDVSGLTDTGAVNIIYGALNDPPPS